MAAKCDVCEIEESGTTLTAFGARGAVRIAVCADCRTKAKYHNPKTRETIREILRPTVIR